MRCWFWRAATNQRNRSSDEAHRHHGNILCRQSLRWDLLPVEGASSAGGHLEGVLNIIVHTQRRLLLCCLCRSVSVEPHLPITPNDPRRHLLPPGPLPPVGLSAIASTSFLFSTSPTQLHDRPLSHLFCSSASQPTITGSLSASIPSSRHN